MPTVLIVDDSIFMRLLIRSIVEKNGFEVIGEAEDGYMGVKKYKECQPDIVTMDITMPAMSGIDALKAIRQYNSLANVVIVSALGYEKLVSEAVINGARSFIVKPFKEEMLIQLMNKIK